MEWKLMETKVTLPDKTMGLIWDHWPLLTSPVTGIGHDSGLNHGNHPLPLYCWSRMSKCLPKMLSVIFYEYMDSERHAFLNTSGGHILCKVNKPHPSFSFKLFNFFPKSGVTHSYTRKAMALPLLNSLHCKKSMIMHVILMVKPSIPKASLKCCDSTNWRAFICIWSNQSAADRAEDIDPSEWNRIPITWERTSSNCNFVPSLWYNRKGIDVCSSW